jgi:hypothetical protein
VPALSLGNFWRKPEVFFKKYLKFGQHLTPRVVAVFTITQVKSIGFLAVTHQKKYKLVYNFKTICNKGDGTLSMLTTNFLQELIISLK